MSSAKTKTISIPKPNNPNLVDVYQVVEQQDDPYSVDPYEAAEYYEEVAPIQGQTSSVVFPGLGLDNEDGNGKGKEEESDYHGLHQPDPVIRLTGEDGVFLYDADTGRKIETFKFDALQRRMYAEAVKLTSPVVNFVAGLAGKTGTSLQNMMFMPEAQLVSTRAKNMSELLALSSLPDKYLSIVMAQTLNSILDSNGKIVVALDGLAKSVRDGAESMNKLFAQGQGPTPVPVGKDKEEAEPSTPFKQSPPARFPSLRPTPTSPFLPGPPAVVKPEPGSNVDKLNAAIQRIESHVFVPVSSSFSFSGLDNSDYARFAQIGALTPAQEQQQQEIMNALASEMAGFLREMSHAHQQENLPQNELVENAGLSVIKGEVVEAIQHAYDEICALSPKHADFKLIHLMTNKQVKHHFALMVAALLNSTPGEIQYPNYTRNFRNNQAVTGARVSSGRWFKAAACRAYRDEIKWFKYVGYEVSSEWKRAQQEFPKSQTRVADFKRLVDRDLEELLRLLSGRLESSIWDKSKLGLDTGTYKVAIVDMYDRQMKRFSLEERLRQNQAKLQSATRANLSAEEQTKIRDEGKKLQDKLSNVMLTITAIGQTLVDKVLSLEQITSIENREIGVWIKALNIEGWLLVPFVGVTPLTKREGDYKTRDKRLSPKYERKLREPVISPDNPYIDYDALLYACSSLAKELRKIIERVHGWRGATGEKVLPVLQAIETALLTTITNVTEFRRALKTEEDTRTVMATFTELDKVELVYREPGPETRPPLTDYSRLVTSGGYGYASI